MLVMHKWDTKIEKQKNTQATLNTPHTQQNSNHSQQLARFPSAVGWLFELPPPGTY
jgi:hypothetical protein